MTDMHLDGRGFRRGTAAAVLLSLALVLPSLARAEERLQAALAVVVPPDASEIDRIVDTVAAGDESVDATRLRARLQKLYGSPEFRQRTAEVYARHLSVAELRYLAETFQHPVFRRYREIAPVLMIELAQIERDLFGRIDGFDDDRDPSRLTRPDPDRQANHVQSGIGEVDAPAEFLTASGPAASPDIRIEARTNSARRCRNLHPGE